MDGIILVDKPKGYTSRDVVNIVGQVFQTKKIGHTGTLDPMATGVLMLCVGSGLKCVEMLMNHDKEYIAKIRLGIETDTLDITGEVIRKEVVPGLTKEDIERVLKEMIGRIKQEVPKYSAIKVNGRKLYEYARAKEEVVLPVHEVEIFELELLSDIVDNEFTIRCSVSKGTYIRSLVRDIGYQLGTVATMMELRRTKLGKFSIDDSNTLEEIVQGKYKLLTPVEVLDLPKMIVSKELEQKIRHGQVLKKFFDGDMVMILNEQQELLAIYQRRESGDVKPYRMFV